MSYRRCWMLVDVMNRCWVKPLVTTSSEGARLTDFGAQILSRYRAMQGAAAGVAETAHWSGMAASLRPEPLAARNNYLAHSQKLHVAPHKET